MTPLGIIAKRVDHVNMRVPEPGALFGTLAETLQLPVLWPLSAFAGLDEAGIPGFEVAGVCVGNTYIEPTRFEPAAAPNRSDDGYAFSVCLEPVSAEDAAGELDRRGIVHSPPIPYIGELPEAFESEIGRQVGLPRGDAQLWSWVFLGAIVGDPALAAHVLLCEFQALNAGAIWRRSREELRRRHGGPLGVQGVREIVIGARDVATEAERWRSLLDPAPVTAGATFELGDGPAIRLTSATDDRIEALVWEVASLDRAKRLLEERGLLGSEGETELRIDPIAMQGLEIRLVAPDPGPPEGRPGQ